jgi:G6PDH family F420-dependent oxidoreductase
MTEFGYFLSCEEHGPAELIEQARMAEQAGFTSLWISDHYHPWNVEQGQSPFIWSVIAVAGDVVAGDHGGDLPDGANPPGCHRAGGGDRRRDAARRVPVRGRQRRGVERAHHRRTVADGGRRTDMLEEAVGVIRALWTGESVHHHGEHYTVEDARIYTLPTAPPPIYVSGFGPKAVDLAARIGDGFVCTKPDADLVTRFRENGGGDKTAQAGFKVCWSRDRETAIDTAFRLWRNAGVPGELSQVLPSPQHFEQAAQLVTRQMTAESTAFGDDPDEHARAFQPFVDAGFDEIFVSQMGAHLPDTNADGFFEFYADKVLPRLRDAVV